MAESSHYLDLRSRQGILTLTAAILASGLGFLMNSAVTIALPTIQRALDTSLAVAQWVVSAYVLTLGALILASGSLGDLFGRKRVFNLGILVFTFGALLAGLAPGVTFLIVFRGIQGVGAALMVPGSLAIINATYRHGERGRAIGLWAGVSGAVAALGPVIGGVLADVSFRFVFLAVVPIGVAAYVTSRLFVPTGELREARKVDGAGIVLVFLSLFGLSFALIRLPDWGINAYTVVCLVGGVLFMAAFLLRERKASDPLLPFRMFNRSVIGANGCTFFLYFAFQGIFFLLSFELQQLFGYSSSVAGLTILPATLLIALFSGPSGYLTDSRGPRFQMITGPAVVVAGCAALVVFTTPGSNLFRLLPGVFVVGVGMVTVIPAITKSALEVEERFSGAASGTNNALARVAGLFAVAVTGSLLVIFYRAALVAELGELGLAAEHVGALAATAEKLLAAELPPGLPDQMEGAVRHAMEGALAAAFRRTMLLNLAAAAVTVGIAIPTIRKADAERGFAR